MSFSDSKKEQNKYKHLSKNSGNGGTCHAESGKRTNTENQQRVSKNIADKTACIHNKWCPAVTADIERSRKNLVHESKNNQSACNTEIKNRILYNFRTAQLEKADQRMSQNIDTNTENKGE